MAQEEKPVREVPGYRVGQYGPIDVLDPAGKKRRWIEGEILRLIPVGETRVWAMIKTPQGVGVYRVW